jgi:hypothetical protein
MATATRAQPLGKLIDHLWEVREKKRALETEVKDLEAKIGEAEAKLMEALQAAGMEKASSSRASVSVTTTTVAHVTDWDEFGKYVIKNKFLHLLQRRVSDPAYRELLEAGKKVPGTEPFSKKRLNLRTVS